MSTVPEADRARLVAMLALAEADQNPADGERLAATGAAERLLAKHGLRLRDVVLISAPTVAEFWQRRAPDWRDLIDACLEQPGGLRPWEADFLRSLRGFDRPSQKQRAILHGIAERLGVMQAAA